MLSKRNRVQTLATTFATAAVVATGALAGAPSSAQFPSGITVDRSAVARHRALGRLGTIHAVTDTAVIARHRALGRLPEEPAFGSPRRETTEAGWPWRASLLSLGVVGASLLVGLGLIRSRGLRTRGAA
jgi:hypothetical protein